MREAEIPRRNPSQFFQGPMTVRMGDGRVIVSTGSEGEAPAVFLRDAPEQGEVGARCPAYDLSSYRVLTLTFPTKEQAQRVADALVYARNPSETPARIVAEIITALLLISLCWAAYLSGPAGRQHAVMFFGVLAVLSWFEWQRGKRAGAT